MGKIENWSRQQERESNSVPFIWTNDVTGEEVVVEHGRTAGVFAVKTPLGVDRIDGREKARKDAVEWMERHPYAASLTVGDSSYHPDTVVGEFETQLEEMAAKQQVRVLSEKRRVPPSVPDDAEVMAVAQIGDVYGKNGRVVDEMPDTEGWDTVSSGNNSFEAEIGYMDAVSAAADELGLDDSVVAAVVEHEKYDGDAPGYVYHSGYTDYLAYYKR